MTVVIPANAKRRSNVALMLGQRRIQWYNIQPTERQVNVNVNVFPFDKQISVYLKVQKLSGTSYL